MIITRTALDSLRTGFQTAFQAGLGMAPSQHGRIATPVSSTTGKEVYGWLGKLPNVREWIGDRVIQNLSEHDYTIKNRPFELTLGVDRDHIEDDNLGIYTPLFQEMGLSTQTHTDQLVWGLMRGGDSALCYDGQPFFDADHPVLDALGNTVSVSNHGGGAGTPWYLMATSRPLKPLILQTRRAWEFTWLDNKDDPNVFFRKEFVYGTDARMNVGFGFWQIAFMSRQARTRDSYGAARAAMMGQKGDFGRPLGIIPDLLVVPPSLEGAGRRVLRSDLGTAGETNEWAGTAELMVSPWLA